MFANKLIKEIGMKKLELKLIKAEITEDNSIFLSFEQDGDKFFVDFWRDDNEILFARFEGAKSVQNGHFKLVPAYEKTKAEQSGESICTCSIPNTTMETPHRCIKCNKPIKWD